MILFSQVKKRVNENNVLENINFIIKRNDFVFIYEKNREIIKSLTDLITGRTQPDEGLIRINNRKKLLPDLCKEIGIVHCDEFFLSKRNLRDNFRFVLELFGKGKEYPEIRINKVLKITDMKKYGNLLPGDLMVHQYIRAGIARAMLLYPSILVLEDPLFFLDEVNSQSIYHLLKKINNFNITIIFLCSDRRYIIRNKEKKVICLNGKKDNCQEEGYHV